MRVLVINPPGEHVVAEFADSEGKGFLESSDYGKFPPLGPLYVLTYAQRSLPQHAYFFLDCVGEGISHDELGARISAIAPDVIGLTSFTISLIDVILAAETARRVAPGAHLCLGGHHPTAFPVESASLPQFDSVIVGEGEYAFADLLDCIEHKRDFTSITGLYTGDTIERHIGSRMHDPRFNGRLQVPAAYVEDVDLLPPPDRSHIQHITYRSIVGLKSRLMTLITSRGCPCKCTFCDVPYKKYRPRNLDPVMDELETGVAQGYGEFHFYDDLFNITANRLDEFCAALQRRGLNIVWDFRGRVNSVTRESLARAKQAGLRMVTFGVETGSDEGLRRLNKGTTTAQIQSVFGWCRELGIRTVADFMIGLPTERTAADVRQNIEFLIRLDPDYAQIAILNLYPNTQVFEEAAQRGLIEPDRWEAWVRDPRPGFRVDHWNEFLTDEELVRLHRESYGRFYLRWRYVFRRLCSLRSLHELTSNAEGAVKLMRSELHSLRSRRKRD